MATEYTLVNYVYYSSARISYILYHFVSSKYYSHIFKNKNYLFYKNIILFFTIMIFFYAMLSIIFKQWFATCFLNQMLNFLNVWPIYWLLQLAQLIEYITLFVILSLILNRCANLFFMNLIILQMHYFILTL